MTDTIAAQPTLDLLTITPSGYATYWLSVKKLMDKRRGPQSLADELQYSTEPFTKLLLEATASNLDEELLRRMARHKSHAVLRDYRRKLRLFRTAACAIASSENPRKTLITLSGTFGTPLVDEAKTMEQAQALLETMRAGNIDTTVFPDVSHATRADELVLKLLFFLLWARREGKAGLTPFLSGMSFHYLADALHMCIDGIEESFIRRRLDSQARELLIDAHHKMAMGLELALAIKNRRSYEEVLALAKAFLPEG